MLRHLKIKKLISSYIDGEVSSREKKLVEEHLKGCRECKELFEQLKKTSAILKKWKDQEISGDLEEKLKNKLSAAKDRGVVKMKSKSKLIPVGVGVGGLVTLLVFALAFQVYLKRGLQSRVTSGTDLPPAEAFPPDSLWSSGDASVRNFSTVEKLDAETYNASPLLFASGEQERVLYATSTLVTGKISNGIGSAAGASPLLQMDLPAEDKTTAYIRGDFSYVTDDKSLKYAGLAGDSYGVADMTTLAEGGDYWTVSANGKQDGLRRHAAITDRAAHITNQNILDADGNMVLSWHNKPEAPVELYSKDTSREGGPVVIVEKYLPATGKEDKIISSAEVTLEVEEVQKIYDDIVKIGKDNGGYLGGAHFEEQGTGRVTAKIILRVPKDKFEEAVGEIRKLGQLKKFDIKSIDVSQEHSTLTAELETLKIVYDKIAAKLKERRTDIQGAIRLESELSPVARRIEAVRNRISRYDNLIAMSTITVNLEATSVKLLFDENFKDLRIQLLMFLSNAIRLVVDFLPFILGVIFVIVVAYIVIVRTIRSIKRIIARKSSQ